MNRNNNNIIISSGTGGILIDSRSRGRSPITSTRQGRKSIAQLLSQNSGINSIVIRIVNISSFCPLLSNRLAHMHPTITVQIISCCVLFLVLLHDTNLHFCGEDFSILFGLFIFGISYNNEVSRPSSLSIALASFSSTRISVSSPTSKEAFAGGGGSISIFLMEK